MDEWVQSHYVGVPQRTNDTIGAIAEKRILDIDCGDCMTALGLLNADAAEVVALDVFPLNDALISRTVERTAAAGFESAAEARKRLRRVNYDGLRIPLPGDYVDIAFSWGVF